jgi:hypothetical protein
MTCFPCPLKVTTLSSEVFLLSKNPPSFPPLEAPKSYLVNLLEILHIVFLPITTGQPASIPPVSRQIISKSTNIFIFIFIFWKHWCLNSEAHACQAG